MDVEYYLRSIAGSKAVGELKPKEADCLTSMTKTLATLSGIKDPDLFKKEAQRLQKIMETAVKLEERTDLFAGEIIGFTSQLEDVLESLEILKRKGL